MAISDKPGATGTSVTLMQLYYMHTT